MNTEEQLITACDKLIEATEKHANRVCHYLVVKESHDREYQTLLYRGEIDGRNDDQRNGYFYTIRQDLCDRLHEAKLEMTSAEFDWKIAQLALEREKVRYTLGSGNDA